MNCIVCGKKISFTFGDERNEELRESQHCFGCTHWAFHLEEMKTDPTYYVVKGNLFQDGGDGKKDIFGYKGHGGYPFYIKCKDGREGTTDNLWHLGKVPTVWLDKYPDTAVFVEKFKEVKLITNEEVNDLQNELILSLRGELKSLVDWLTDIFVDGEFDMDVMLADARELLNTTKAKYD